jgi:ACR3 family arsenite transporter
LNDTGFRSKNWSEFALPVAPRLAYFANRAVGEKHSVACPSALIGASNFFELAVAAAISLFGFESGAALATVVGVLIEVPVMLLVVRWVNASKGWYEAGAAR